MTTNELTAELKRMFPDMEAGRIDAFANACGYIPQEQEERLMKKNTTDTPETDAAERLYSERQHHYAVRDLCRKLERERDAALRELAELKKPMKPKRMMATPYTTDTHTIEQHTRDRLRDYEKAWPELHRELVELKAQNITLRNAQMCCESCDETITTESLKELRKDKERLDWLHDNTELNCGGWIARGSTTGRGLRVYQQRGETNDIRQAIDAAKQIQ